MSGTRLPCRIGLVLLCLFLLGGSALAFSGSSPWFLEELEEAETLGLVPDGFQDKPMTEAITRREFCALGLLLYESFGGGYGSEPLPEAFIDCGDELARRAYAVGIVTGYEDGSFRPEGEISRQEMFKLLYNVLTALDYEPELSQSEAAAELSGYEDRYLVQQWAELPAGLMLKLEVTRGLDESRLDPVGSTAREQALVMVKRFYSAIADGSIDKYMCFTGTEQAVGETEEESLDSDKHNAVENPKIPRDEPVDEEFDPDEWDFDGIYAENYDYESYFELSYDEKYSLIFGSPEADKYRTEEEALGNMVEITVPVWNYNTEGVKVSTRRTFQMHEKIAPLVKLIFQEIYEGGERFPIYSIGGYCWRGDGVSEHNWGLAIDINPDENMMIRDGRILAGQLWEPGINKYSIPEDGDVVAAFAKYGFSWGGNAWRSCNDYMHFSFLGT